MYARKRCTEHLRDSELLRVKLYSVEGKGPRWRQRSLLNFPPPMEAPNVQLYTEQFSERKPETN